MSAKSNINKWNKIKLSKLNVVKYNEIKQNRKKKLYLFQKMKNKENKIK